MRSAQGQGTVEYLAVVLLVALVFGGTATVASGAAGDIAAAVPREIIRGLCIVRGGDCYRDVAPCDVASSAKSKNWAVTIAVFEFGHDKTVTKTRRSDGTYAVTLDTAPRGGVDVTEGGRAVLKRGKRAFAAGSAIGAEVTGSYAHQRTWIVASEDAAQRLIGAIGAGDDLPPADLDGHKGSLQIGAGGSKTAGRVDVSGSILARLDLSSQTERATGRTTYALGEALDGSVKAALIGMSTAASTSAGVGARVALTVGADGRWLDLAITGSGDLSRRVDLPPSVAPIADRVGVRTAAGHEWVAESHLDLTDPDNLAAVEDLLARLRNPLHPEPVGRAVDALARRMQKDAVIDVRTYALDSDPSVIDVQAGDTLKVGGRYDATSENTRLIAARTRAIDGRWVSRDDCVQEARK